MKKWMGIGWLIVGLCLLAGCVAPEDRTPGYLPGLAGEGTAAGTMTAYAAAQTTAAATTDAGEYSRLQSEVEALRQQVSQLQSRMSTTVPTTARSARPIPTTQTTQVTTAAKEATAETTTDPSGLPPEGVKAGLGETVDFPTGSFRVDQVEYVPFMEEQGLLSKEGRQYIIITCSMKANGVPNYGPEYHFVGEFLQYFNMSDGRALNGAYGLLMPEEDSLPPGIWHTLHVYKEIAADARVISLTFWDPLGYPYKAEVSLEG